MLPVSSKRDLEFAQANAGKAPFESSVRKNFTPKKVLTFIIAAVGAVGLMLGIGMLASYLGKLRLHFLNFFQTIPSFKPAFCVTNLSDLTAQLERSAHSHHEIDHTSSAYNQGAEFGHQLAVRAEDDGRKGIVAVNGIIGRNDDSNDVSLDEVRVPIS